MPSVDATALKTSLTVPAVQQLELDNGLQAVWEEDRRQPLVAIEARIAGGLRGEGAQLGTGITHFIEHMLFKGTPTRPPGTIDQEVRRYGGTINAFTSMDTTGVSLFVESRYLKEALAMLADILQHAVFEPAEFDKERAVIISEIQMNLDDPNRRIHQLFWSRHFREHPYRHPILGYQPLLERLTVKELTAFYASQYQPQRITLACAGDLDGAAFPALVKELFGGWARGKEDPSQQVVAAEPPVASAKTASVELSIQTAYAILGFTSTRLSDRDTYPLDVLANILGQGESSRLNETVVRQRKLADAVSAWNYTPADPGIFAIQFRSSPERVAPAQEAIVEIIKQIQANGITKAELEKAKRSVTADYLFNLQTIEARAGDLASSLSMTGDPLFSRRYVERVARVNAEQVQEVARRYCDPSVMTAAIIRPQSQSAAPKISAEQSEPLPVTKATLPNGATALIGTDHRLPVVAIVAAFKGGVRVEPEPQQGLSNLVAQMLTKGTKRKNALQIAQQVEALGGTLEPFSGRDGFGLVLQLLSQDVDEGLALMHELIAQSAFPEPELQTQQRLITQLLLAQEDEIFDVGGRLLRRTLFGQHPYRFHPLGDAKTIGTLTRGDCNTFARQWMVPSNMVVAGIGDIDRSRIEDALQRSFGKIPSRPSAWPDRLAEPPLERVETVHQTMEKEQALIMMGFRGSTQTAPDRQILDVMTAIFSGMAGRLFQAVREEHGLSYTLGAAHVPGWDPGYLLIYAATRPNEQQQVLTVLTEQLQLAIDRGFTDEEVEQAKRYLIGMHRMDVQHLVGLAKRIALDELYGVGFDAWATYDKKVEAVSAALVHEAARRYLTLGQRAEVVISSNGHTP